MTHLRGKIEKANEHAHAFKVAKEMALERAKGGDKTAPKRAERFARKEAHFRSMAARYEGQEAVERRLKA